jgi:zinc D-Ala-D-Ala dipeptidase
MTALVLAAGLALAQAPDAGGPLVDVAQAIPGVTVDLRYATADNFMGVAVYPPQARCLLLKPVVERLARAARTLARQGYRLKLLDCYRPASVQWKLWEVMPRPGYVADPRTGSNHSRGGAVDLTLQTAGGGAVELPSAYDFFGPAAHHAYQGGSARARANRGLLRRAMEAAGFTINPKEWWHYDAPEARGAPLRDEPFAAPGSR